MTETMTTMTTMTDHGVLRVEAGGSPDGVPYVRVRGVYPFDAKATFLCGQCFRFDPVEAKYSSVFGTDEVYGGVAAGRYINVASPDPDTVVIEGATADEFERIWKPYFGFDMDYAGIIESVHRIYGGDSRIARAADAGAGIRILRQERWETLCSFIISQNNNIPRIKTIIERLCGSLGGKFEFRGGEYHKFPTASAVSEAGVDGIAFARMGFRARYVAEAAGRVLREPEFFERVAEADSVEAGRLLCELTGVGVKVASCTLLFGFGRYEAFPVDVWIRRTVGKYFDGEPDKIDFGELAPYAGILQQYIFNYERNLGGGE